MYILFGLKVMCRKNLLFVFLLFIIVFSLSISYANDVNDTLNYSDGDVSIYDESIKNDSQLSSPKTSIYYNGNYSVVLKDVNNSEVLRDREIKFTINKVNYTAKTDNNGVASIKLNLNVGKYFVNVNFTGDENYNNCSLSNFIEILSPIKATNITKYYKSTTSYTVQFFDTQGFTLNNKLVNVSVNGKTYSQKTNNKGVVSIPINFKPGSYKIISTNPAAGYQLTTTFNILSTIVSSDTKQFEGVNKRFSVKFFKSNGKVLSKKYIKYKFKGKIYKVKTNSKGIVSFSLKKLKKGTYKIVCYNKDGLSKTFKIKIYKKKASTKLTSQFYTFNSNDNREIKVKFSTALGDGSKSGKIIKIKINGKAYLKKTDNNGIAILNLASFNKGLYKVEYQYKGNKFFKASKSTNYVTIVDSNNTSLNVKSTKSFGYGANTLFKLSLTANSVPLIKKSVKVDIAGKSYTKTTDERGMISIPITLKVGNYTVDYRFNGDSDFNKSSGSCDIVVFERTSSKLTWKCGSLYKDSSQTFSILLTTSKGQAISGGIVELKIGSKSYFALTSSSGYAKFKTSVDFGNYKITVKFKGNNYYIESQSSKNINVKLSLFGKGLNEKKVAGYLSAYLKSSSHCKVGSKYLKKLVKYITKGSKDNIGKTKAIFNYVRDKIDYDFYYNSLHGSGGTLKYKKGNCADISNLLVAMYRTAGFKTRYVHGVCKFNSGHVYGHVWVQVHVGKYWVCADASDNDNSFGKITNWNTKSYKMHAKYMSLPF